MFAFVDDHASAYELVDMLSALQRGTGSLCIRVTTPKPLEARELLQAFVRGAAANAAEHWTPEPVARFLASGDPALAEIVDSRGAELARRTRGKSPAKSLPHRAAGVVSWAARAHRPELASQIGWSVGSCIVAAAAFAGYIAALAEFNAGGHRLVSRYWPEQLASRIQRETQEALVQRLADALA